MCVRLLLVVLLLLLLLMKDGFKFANKLQQRRILFDHIAQHFVCLVVRIDGFDMTIDETQ